MPKPCRHCGTYPGPHALACGLCLVCHDNLPFDVDPPALNADHVDPSVLLDVPSGSPEPATLALDGERHTT